jgi:hypothetical protein
MNNIASTEIALYKLINEVLNALNNKHISSWYFRRFNESIDCDNYILLSKLELYGTVGKAKAWVKSYLKDRYHRILINNWNIHTRWGIPQGSILGLLMFILYINDLPNIMSSKLKLVLFADDTSQHNYYQSQYYKL